MNLPDKFKVHAPLFLLFVLCIKYLLMLAMKVHRGALFSIFCSVFLECLERMEEMAPYAVSTL